MGTFLLDHKTYCSLAIGSSVPSRAILCCCALAIVKSHSYSRVHCYVLYTALSGEFYVAVQRRSAHYARMVLLHLRPHQTVSWHEIFLDHR